MLIAVAEVVKGRRVLYQRRPTPLPRTVPTFQGAGLIGLLEAGGMRRERIVEYLDAAPQLVCEWAEAIEPMPMDEYAALPALLTDMIKDVER